MQPTVIPNVTAAVLAPFRSGFGRFVQSFSSPFSSTQKREHSKRDRPHSRIIVIDGNNTAAQLIAETPSLNRSRTGTGSGEGLELFDNSKDHLALEGTKAERR